MYFRFAKSDHPSRKDQVRHWGTFLRWEAALLLMIWTLTSSGSTPGQVSDVEQILELISSMEQAWSDVTDYTKEVRKTERFIDGSLTQQTVLQKFRRPNQYYMRILEGPGQGGELIYPKNKDELFAVAHAGGFRGKLAKIVRGTVLLRGLVPTEFSLQDPEIIKGQHQTVLESNLGQTIHQIAKNIRTAAEFGEGKMQLEQECPEDSECMYRIDIELPTNTGELHEVMQGESLWTIASKFDCPMYVIWYNNPKMRKPTDIRPGQTVFVPRYYAAKGHIWISKRSKLLAKLVIFDRDGELYEQYVYSKIQSNVGLTDRDFDTRNPDYDF
jgi:outer membrane lipoprotein-sorting protein